MIKGYRYLLIVFLALGFLTSSCEEENLKFEPAVLTEQLLFVSGEQVRLSGRLVANESQNVTEHGFTISADESFSSPLTIALGPRSLPGRFIGEISGLTGGQSYFWKAFIIIDGSLIEGSTYQFSTLLPEITSYSPATAFAGSNIFISGRNFGSDTKVFFDNEEAEILDIDRESVIKARIPPIGNSSIVDIKVVTKSIDLTAEQPFEYVIGKWELIDHFITPYYYSQNISFIDGANFYFGIGYENNLPNETIWKLDIPSMQWSETSYDKNVLISSFFGPSFLGSGRYDSGIFSSEFIVFENENFISKNPLPFSLTKGVAFKIGQHIYAMGGNAARNELNYDVFKYYAEEDSWEFHTKLGINVTGENPYFIHGSYAYFITSDKFVYRFDPVNITWEKISVFPSNSVEFGNGAYQVIGDFAYIGLFLRDRTIWEYNIPDNSWKPKIGFPGDSFNKTATSFTYDGTMYVLKNPSESSSEGMNIWTFNPDQF